MTFFFFFVFEDSVGKKARERPDEPDDETRD